MGRLGTTSTAKDAWSLIGRERYLKGAALHRKAYYRWSATWTHDHCELCGVGFATPDEPYRTEEDRHEGHTTVARGELPDDYHRICEDCFGDFKHTFRG